jgi:hypothetical protein
MLKSFRPIRLRSLAHRAMAVALLAALPAAR